MTELANDLKLFKYLAEAKDKGEYPYFSKAVEDLKDQMDRAEVSKNMDKPYDLGLVNPKWEKCLDGKWAYVWWPEPEAEYFIKDKLVVKGSMNEGAEYLGGGEAIPLRTA